MKKGIFAMFILVASMAMVACTNANATNEGAVGEKLKHKFKHIH